MILDWQRLLLPVVIRVYLRALERAAYTGEHR